MGGVLKEYNVLNALLSVFALKYSRICSKQPVIHWSKVRTTSTEERTREMGFLFFSEEKFAGPTTSPGFEELKVGKKKIIRRGE